MNLVFADWLIVIVMMSLMVWGVLYSRKLMQSVSDFLSANRSAGRYIVSFSQGMAQLGAITIVGMLEMNYIAGFTLRWWEYANGIVLLIIAVSGWVIYRFRETRALTMAQFLEMRYSRNFRIFSGSLAFISGIINFGLFPAVGARFFMYFIGLPQTYNFLGIQVSTLATLMIMLLAVSLFFVFVGGQISVMIADFIQGWFVNVTFVVISIYLVTVIDWNIVTDALLSAPENASLINPFNASGIQDYNFWYFLIGMIGLVYGKLTWQGTQGYYVSARNPHEAKMGEVLGNWRLIPQWSLFLIFVPVIAYTVMHHPSYSAIVESIQPTLDTIDNEALRTQITVPMVLTKLLPVGLIGSFIAIMIAAFVSTHDTYLHSWASIFIQDIVLPLRTKHLPQKLHLRMLKAAILGVAIFIFFFSLIFQQSEYIFLFFAITGSIFAGGAGSVIIGGLYWKKGTTAAAWTAMITGLVISVGGIILQQVFPGFPINGQMFWGIAMFSSAGSYVLVSLLSRKPDFNLDKLLHRGKYSIEDDSAVVTKAHSKIWKYFGVGKEFTKGDK
ncbi:MAG: sodium:solute symporter, partial [Candidatus Cloacimonetes bacterium]|nr:sodium:solute symporter [Candidatus Cloacimonadota bacterium]